MGFQQMFHFEQSFTIGALAVAVLATSACGDIDPHEGEEFETKSQGIINGEFANVKQFPWFVQQNGCGGTLVAKDVVLTAAHCIGTAKGRVLVGAFRENNANAGDAQWRQVKSKMYRHPRYSSKTNSNDFMIYKIQAVTKPHLKPIALNRNNGAPSVGAALRVIGMGALNPAGTQYGPELRWANLKAVGQKTCNARYGGWINGRTMLCAANFAARKDSCYGDSGGPMIDKYGKQVGVVSFGADCADKYYPGVYARVSGAINWIDSTICSLSDHKPLFCKNGN